jgi:hypothetical protein
LTHNRYRRPYVLAVSITVGVSAAFASVLATAGGAGAAPAPAARVSALSPAACSKLTGELMTFGTSPAAKVALSVFGGSAGSLPKNAPQLKRFHHSMVVLAAFATLIKGDLKGPVATQDAGVIKVATGLEHGGIAKVDALAGTLKSDPKLAASAASFQSAIGTLYAGCTAG